MNEWREIKEPGWSNWLRFRLSLQWTSSQGKGCVHLWIEEGKERWRDNRQCERERLKDEEAQEERREFIWLWVSEI